MSKNFPNNFIFGAATAAYQVEGSTQIDGRGKCIWDDWYHRPNSKFNADIACDFYNLYPLDLKIGKSIGLNSIRISISWSRIFPSNNEYINQKGIEFYHNLIDECIKRGIEPMVTLHHFDSPQWIVDQGDFLSKQTIEDFFKYAKICFEEYGDKVKKWATFNEPYVYNSDKYIYGESPPNEVGKISKSIQAMHNMMVAHAKVVKYYHDNNFDGKIGIVHVLQPKYPYDETNIKDIEAAHKATILYSQFMLDANYFGYYSHETINVINYLLSLENQKLITSKNEDTILMNAKNKTDFLGINYYNPTWFIDYNGETIISHNSDGNKGTSVFLLKGLGEAKTPSHIKTTEWDWPIYAKGLTDIMVYVKERYSNYNEIFITENGIGYKESLDLNNKVFDDYRIEYLSDHLNACLDAIYNYDIKISGFYVWSWQDMFSWTNGFNKRYGLFFVDFSNQKRYYKLSAFWFSEVIDKKTINLDLKEINSKYEKFISSEFTL